MCRRGLLRIPWQLNTRSLYTLKIDHGYLKDESGIHHPTAKGTIFGCLPAQAKFGNSRNFALHHRPFEKLFEFNHVEVVSNTSISPIFEQQTKLAHRDISANADLELKSLCLEGRVREALDILDSVVAQGTRVYFDSCACILQACANKRSLEEGREVHNHLNKNALRTTVFLENSLINMYSKCGSIEDASRVFDKMALPNVYTYTIMIAGYVQYGKSVESLELFFQMEQMGIKLNKVTSISVLSACAKVSSAVEGKRVHSVVLKAGFALDTVVGTTIVDMYMKCGVTANACQVFDRMPDRSIVSWNAITTGFAQQRSGRETLLLFNQIKREGLEPTQITFVGLLSACATGTLALDNGKWIHASVQKAGYADDLIVASTMVDMYSKSGSTEGACLVFDRIAKRNVYTWTTLISTYSQAGQFKEAHKLFLEMRKQGVKANEFTFATVLNICAGLPDLDLGKQIHVETIEQGCELDAIVSNSLLGMYLKCGRTADARDVFNKMTRKSILTWTTMIAAYAQVGDGMEAINLFERMLLAGLQPNDITFASILNACASISALGYGKQVHDYIRDAGYESDIFICNTLIDMYGKCGCIEAARQVFDGMFARDVVAWNAMIGGYAQYGDGNKALMLFRQMREEGIMPNPITFVSILSVCNHACLVEESRQYFQLMSRDYCIAPLTDHYVCMVNILSHSGYLQEAEDFIKKIPFRTGAIVWIPLLSACRAHGAVQVAERTVENILRMEPSNSAAFVLLANVYAEVGRLDDSAKLRARLESHGLKQTEIFLERGKKDHE